MTILRMDNAGIVFDDLDAAVAFFVELGLELEGKMTWSSSSAWARRSAVAPPGGRTATHRFGRP